MTKKQTPAELAKKDVIIPQTSVEAKKYDWLFVDKEASILRPPGLKIAVAAASSIITLTIFIVLINVIRICISIRISIVNKEELSPI